MNPMTLSEFDGLVWIETGTVQVPWLRIRAALEHRERLVDAARRVLIYEFGSPEEGKAFNDLEALVAEGKDGDS